MNTAVAIFFVIVVSLAIGVWIGRDPEDAKSLWQRIVSRFKRQ